MSRMKKFVSMLLALLLTVTGCFGLNVAAATEDSADIVSADMSIESAKNNAAGYYSNDDWEEHYPEGLYVIEYNSYEITEGGPDAENPEDIYLGIVVYRIGGNSRSATLTYNLITVSGDNEMYPDLMGTVDFAPQQVTATAKVKIPNDNKRNGNQLLMMTLTDATSGLISDASTAMIKVFDDEPYVESVFTMVADKAVADKSDGGITVTVKRTENDTDYCTVLIKSADATAKAGVDYEAFEEEIVFGAGVTEQKVTVPFIPSNEKFAEPKYFNLTMENIRGGVAGDSGSIRLGVTNKLDESTGKVINADNAKADMAIDESTVLASNENSVLNQNDTLNRADMLKAAVGAANGKAFTILADTGKEALLQPAENTNYWSETLSITPKEFSQLYSSGDSWKHDEEFSDNDEDLLVATDSTFNFNLYDAIIYSCYSRDKEGLGALSGNPNTALGYLDSQGHTYSGNNLGSCPEGDDINTSNTNSKKWMTDNDIYILKNYLQYNLDSTKTPITLSLSDNNGNRYPKTTGSEGSAMRPFYFVYNVKGQDSNHFKITETRLLRTVIPFSVFADNADYTVLSDQSGFTFTKNNYKWTVKVDTQSKNGGVFKDAVDETATGFYAGSTLDISFQPLTSGASMPVPTVLYLTDSKGNVHNFSQASGNSFTVTLETNMNNDTDTLKNAYLMSDEQIKAHNELLVSGGCINSAFADKLTIDCQYAIQQGVEVSYRDIPHVYEGLENLSEEAQKSSILESLGEVVKFYQNNELVSYKPEVYLDKKVIFYEIVEFDNVVVDPKKAGDDVKATSNLYSAEYKTITKETTINRFVCSQISTVVNFRLSYLESDYVEPELSLASTYVGKMNDGKLETVYIANYIDDYVPFEALFTDRSQTPDLAYYCMNFVISDIYVGSYTEDMAVKDYPVTVYSGDIDSRNHQKLFSFTYHGGANFSQASKLSLEIEDGVFDANYLPEVELVSYSQNGYEYRMYIPTYYNYQNTNDKTYPAVISGGQGVTIEVGNYNNGDDSYQEIISVLNPKDTQYVCTKVIDFDATSPEESQSGMYYEQQEDFYTYTDHVINANTSPVNLDMTGFGTFLCKLFTLNNKPNAAKRALNFAGNGVYVKFWDNQMTVGIRIGGNSNNLVPKPKEELPEIEMDDLSGSELNATDILNMDTPVVDPVSNKGVMQSIKDTAGKTNAEYKSFTFGVFVDTKVDLCYNPIRNEWDFSSFSISGSGNFSYSKGIPIPAAANLVYVSFSIKGGLSIGSGFAAVKDYVDLDGNVKYALSFNGFTVAPNLAVSIGAGIGLSGVLAFEVGGSAEFSAAVTFGRQKIAPKLAEFDLDVYVDDKYTKITDKYSGNWKTCLVANTSSDDYLAESMKEYFYNNTYVISETEGDVVVIEGEGTAFQLVGVTKPDGGDIRVTVYTGNSDTPVQQTQTLSLKSEQTSTHIPVFEWKMDDFDNPDKATPTQIKVVIENAGGKVILDSAKLYREDNYKKVKTPASFDAASARLSMYVKLTVAFFSLNLEPAYMLIKYSNIGSQTQATITLGTVYYSKTWDVSGANRMLANNSENLPLVVVGDSGIRSNEEVNYFDTGEFSAEKTKTLIEGDVLKNSKTQVVNYKNKTLAFFTELITNAETGECHNALYCNVPSYGNVLVSNDIYITDFNAYVDNNSKLCVEFTASDSTVKSVILNENNTAKLMLSDGREIDVSESSALSEILQRTCVRVASYNDDGTFSTELIKATDANSRQESLPETAVTSNNSVVFFAEDEAEYNADFKLDWESFDKDSSTVADIENLMNSMFTGQGVIRYAVSSNGKYSEPQTISVKESFDTRFDADILTGIRITEIAASAAKDGTVCLSYAVELPDVIKDTHKGVLKEIHYREGVINEDGSLKFSDPLIVDSVIDYDENLEDVLGPDEYTSQYYNPATDEIYENPIIRNLQMENAVLYEENSENADAKPCLFYQTNIGINCVSYSKLSQALKAKNDGKTIEQNVKRLYNGYFNDYIVAVSEAGEISIIFIENTETSAYTDTLNIIDYDSENHVWNHARQLTYSSIFDEEALNNREKTYGMTIDNMSAFVDARGNVSVAFKSNYAPFTYEYGVNLENLKNDNAPVDAVNNLDGVYVDSQGNEIEYMVAPMLDFESEEARSDIYMISFKERVTAIDVSGFDMLNKIFAPGETVSLNFDIENTGDTILDVLNVTLYICDEDKYISNPVATRVLSGFNNEDSGKNGLLAGDTIEQYFEFDINEIQSNNSLLCIMITDENDNVLFDSYDSYLLNTNSDEADDKEVTYHTVNNCAELEFNAIDVEIDANGKMTFRTDIANTGTSDMTKPAKVYFKAYTEDEDGNTSSKTLFSFTQYPLDAGSSDLYFDTYDVDEYIKNGELKYSFDISYDEPQFDTSNDSTGIVTNYQVPEISLDGTTISTVLNQMPAQTGVYGSVALSLGDVLELDSRVVSKHFGDIHLRAYEVDTDCLSIDNSSSDGRIKVKAVDMPKDGKAKLLLNIKGTTIYRVFYIYVTDKDVLNFDSNVNFSGFGLSDKIHMYAKGADILTANDDKSKLTFDFYGDDLSIFGNCLVNGGEFMLVVTNSSGEEVIREKVSTVSPLTDYGILLYQSEKLKLDKYTVEIEAILDEGETLSLDYARFTIDTTDADVSPYASIGRADEILDAPLVNGRSRKAQFNLTFSSAVKLKEGVEFKDITVEFDEYECIDGEYKATGNTVLFTAEEIKDGNVLVLSSELSSKQGTILKYVLKDSNIPENTVVTKKGTAVNTAIPDYDKVSYVLKESGILSVIVADDKEMPDGSVQKSVKVKFMTAPDVTRLEGTKLLYTTVNSNNETEIVEFNFCKITQDPRVALYRASSLELEKNETSKLFSFSEGIVLGKDNYVLVTAQGDYLDNNISQVITDKTQLDIYYSKLKVTESQTAVLSEITENGILSTFALYADFEDKVDISDLNNSSRAYVTINAEFKDNASKAAEVKEYTLYAHSLSEDGKTLCFKADESIVLDKGCTVKCSVKDNTISYTDENAVIRSAYDGIEVNPQLENCRNLTFNSSAYIISATPYFEGGSFKVRDNVLCAQVLLSGAVDAETLKNTSLDVNEIAKEYDYTRNTVYKLSFAGAEIKGSGENQYTSAVYKYVSEADEISFNSCQYSKTFIASHSLTADKSSPVKSADGKEVYGYEILHRNSVRVSKLQAEKSELKLIENGDDGYKLGLDVSFGEDIIAVVTDQVYAVADMTVDENSVAVYLTLDSVENNVLSFVCHTPFSLKSGDITTFTLRNVFESPATFVTDADGIPVSQLLENPPELVCDTSDKGVAKKAEILLASAQKDKLDVVAKVIFDEKLNVNSFEGAAIDSRQVIYYSDGSQTAVEAVLKFAELENENTALFKAELTIPKEAAASEVILGEEIKPASGSCIYNQNRTLILNTSVPQISDLELNKACSDKTAFLVLDNKEKIESLNDVQLHIVYPENIIAEACEGISLKVAVRGIKGLTDVNFKALNVLDGNTLVFEPDGEISGEYASIVTLSVKDCVIKVEDGSAVYSARSGLSVSTAVKDEEIAVLTVYDGAVVPPADTTPVASDTEEVTEAVTQNNSTEPKSTQAFDKTEAVSDNTTEGNIGESLTTGSNFRFIIVISFVLMAVSLGVILMLRKKKA